MLVSFLTEMIVTVIVFLIPVQKRKFYYLRFVAGVALLYLVIGKITAPWGNIINLGKTIPAFIMSILPVIVYYGFHIILLVALIYITVDVKLTEATFIFSIAYACEHMAYCIRIMIEYISGGIVDNKTWYIYIPAHLGICLLSYVLLAKSMTKGGHYRTDAITSIWTGIVVIVLVLVMSLVATAKSFGHIHAIYAFMACLLLVSMERGQVMTRIEEEEFALREKLWAKKKMQYELSKDAMAIVNQNYHDIKHQIAAVNAMTSSESRQEALRKMEENIAVYDSVVHTENELLDTVLTEKRLICDRNNIPMSCICDGKALLFMDGLDLYTLLGNAFDNAIEANEKIHEVDRFLSVKIQNQKGMTIVEITNPVLVEPVIVGGRINTSKQNQDYHGFGMRSMNEIVRKYEGIIEYKSFDKLFMVRMIFQK
ncbi:MAG: sensor histidine kinase [Lachnospiraceae bacterium]|nr:sensor histidine kinase [Lachnospiraceae bacterium]